LAARSRAEFVDALCRLADDAGEDVGEVGLGAQAAEDGGVGQRVDQGGALAPGIGSGEQEVLAERPLGWIVFDRQVTIVKVAGQPVTTSQRLPVHGRDVGASGNLAGAHPRAAQLSSMESAKL
jgi:hypothetical protein